MRGRLVGTGGRDDLISGMTAGWVAEMFFATHTLTEIGILHNGWPDGGAFLDQPAKWAAIVKICRDETLRWVKEQRGKRN